MKITANSKIADVLKAHPELKEKLIARAPRFKQLNNPIVFNTVGKFADITTVSKVAGEDLDELLAFLNSAIVHKE